jgi:hypothetical protein
MACLSPKRLLGLVILLSSFLANPQKAFAQLSTNNPFIYKEVPSCTDERTANSTIMRFYGNRYCGGCNAQKSAFLTVMAEYEGRITYILFDKNDWDDIPAHDLDIWFEFDERTIAPTTVLGCQYYNVGATGEGKLGYQPAMREVIDYLLTGATPSPTVTPTSELPSPTPTPSPAFSLSSGWNEIVWPEIAGKKASDVPPECPMAVAKENFWLRSYVKNYGGEDFGFETGKSYFLKCNQEVTWNL